MIWKGIESLTTIHDVVDEVEPAGGLIFKSERGEYQCKTNNAPMMR
jgi:hypothetical protein